jgi:CO dehydrogenase/acetyl-CoA synthase gamma subunit (corrinoid Fe-S protein)
VNVRVAERLIVDLVIISTFSNSPQMVAKAIEVRNKDNYYIVVFRL